MLTRHDGRRTILEYVADCYYLAEAFCDAQSSGVVPWDEPFHRSSLVETGPNGEVTGGLDATAIRYLSSCEGSGSIPNRIPDTFIIRVPEHRNVRCVEYLAIAPNRFIHADIHVRDFRFVGITPSELAENLAIIEIADRVKKWLSNAAPVAINRERLAKDFAELQRAVDAGCFLSAGSHSANRVVAGGLPPLHVRFGTARGWS